MNLTAGYNADIAREYGIVEALLLDSIVFWSRNSRRKDGFCWFTADEFEVKTAVKSGAMKRAIDKLVKAGIIETKNTYIVGTQIKCRHFKIVETPKSQTSEIIQPDCTETTQSGTTETTQSVNSSNISLTKLHIAKAIGETPEKYGKEEINELFEYWQEKTGYELVSKTRANRFACSNLLKKHGAEKLKRLIDGVAMSQSDRFAPRIADFSQLQSKQNELMVWGRTKITTKRGVEL